MNRWLRSSLVLIVAAIGFGYWLLRDVEDVLRRPLLLQAPAVFEIAKGRHLEGIAADLDDRSFLPTGRARLYLRLYGRLNPNVAALKAGEYQLTPGMTPIDAMNLFASGKVLLHELRIVEGWRFAQALEAVRQNEVLQHTLPATAAANEVMAAIGRPDEDAEGRFFPDTYRFPRGTSDVAFLKRAYAANEKLLQEEWDKRDNGLPYRMPYQALIMASIVERETGLPDERAQIAGVFVRRLQKGMRLQTDPTVIYGLGLAFDGNLRKRDLLADAPYNTYTREGLPPTPICLPGRAALQAALHPASGNTFYFVSRGDGSHEFSATLKEHEAAVRRYQLGRAQ